ncbi:MAG: hypothetical protein CMI60_05540 [Parvibaculum sp.]|nr:hypothetical protein [Parvibaculum sp.]
MNVEKTIYSFDVIKDTLHNADRYRDAVANVVVLVAKDGQDLEIWYHKHAHRYEICLGLDEWVLETKSWLSVKRKLRQLNVEVV